MLAEHAYEIRNRTVHTIEDLDELGPLLPFDPEVETLEHDTALVRFLAQETLAVSARPLERLRQRRQVSPCRVEDHRSGRSTQPPKRLTVPDPGSPLRRSANAAS